MDALGTGRDDQGGKVLQSILEIPKRFGRQKAASYIAELDGLRCLAIVLVLLWHSSLRADRFLDQAQFSGNAPNGLYGYFPHGEIGVDLFFFISGFVVAQPFLIKPPSEWSIKTFYWRRLLRIYPPYLAAMTGCFVVLGLLGWVPKGAQAFNQPNLSLLDSYLASLFYAHSIIIGTASRLNPPMWSLEIEVFFYAIVPFLLVLYTRLGGSRRRQIVGCFVVLASIVANASFIDFDLRFRLGLASHLYILVFGIIVADLASDWSPKTRTYRWDAATLVGLLLLLLAGLSMTEHDAKMSSSAYALILQLDILAALSCLYVGAMTGRLSRRLLTQPWVCLIGTMCYSIYLTHIITMQVLSQILQGVLHSTNRFIIYVTFLFSLTFCSIVIAFLYYLVVERPFARGRVPKFSRGLAWGGASRDVQPNLVAVKSGRHQPADGMR